MHTLDMPYEHLKLNKNYMNASMPRHFAVVCTIENGADYTRTHSFLFSRDASNTQNTQKPEVI